MSDSTSGAYRWGVLGIIMMGTFMSILDSSIVNVALPRMMSTFGVNRNQIEWVSTGSMLASAVTMPLVGWTIGRVGHKTLYLSAMLVFILGSAACAFSWSYNSLILARLVQAVGTGGLQPTGMAMVASLFEPQERGRALGIWGTGVMVGPAIGPTLGGYLTDTFSWRTVFSVNLPFGFLTLIAGLMLMRSDRGQPRLKLPFDWWGYLFLAMALITSLLALSKGQEMGWRSTYIRTCIALSIVGFTMFAAIESATRHPLLDLKLFLYRNFTISMLLGVFRSVGLFGGMFLLPIFLQNLSGYTAIQAGLWVMPGALVIGVMMPFSGRMADRYGPRWLATFGTVTTAFSLFMYSRLDPLSGWTAIIGPQLIRGVGLAFMMAPLMTAAINAVPTHQVAMASSFLNVTMRLGGSFGIAFLNTYVTNAITRHTVRLGEIMSAQSEAFHRFSLHVSDVVAASLKGQMLTDAARGIFTASILRLAKGPISTEQLQGLLQAIKPLIFRANVLGFEDGFVLAGLIVLAGAPLCLLLRFERHRAPGMGGM